MGELLLALAMFALETKVQTDHLMVNGLASEIGSPHPPMTVFGKVCLRLHAVHG